MAALLMGLLFIRIWHYREAGQMVEMEALLQEVAERQRSDRLVWGCALTQMMLSYMRASKGSEPSKIAAPI